ncbi:related to SKI6 - Exosome non-catalytic core component [Melanopsichium pennsylvanicum]|uniref:Related to SKI6 - Exosome non-catalytic core component n=2 Tax=Melanopsichium pennsylvanicum TaxID=63383 RepID=A0AAJ5C7N7_9BASI|nr:conserved hypothetical protein [Melanopsichium pennsylvanicum 4]SNX87090.1 related to SKI6 - Exosome non-catalytic core component [Melanopsichium pennsylvanicum]
MSKFDRRRVNGPPSYVPVYEGPSSTASSSAPIASTSQQRPDNRAYSELRPIFLQTNLVSSASGSSYVEIGDLKLACSVFGPRQVKGRQYSGKAELNVEVKFAPFSSRRRRTPGKTTESENLSVLLHQALLPSLRLDLLPKASLDVHIMVLQTDGLDESCIAASCIAATTALASAGIEMFGLVVGSVALVPANAENLSQDKRVLLDPSTADIGLVTAMKTGSRILMCGMPALASVTCLNVTAGSTQFKISEDGEKAVMMSAGIDAEVLDEALDKVHTSLIEIHKVVAQALAEDFERRTALSNAAN